MEQRFDKVICSDTQKDTGYFQIASGYISETVILFEKENVIAKVQAKGQVAFYDRQGGLLATGAAPVVDAGREVYEELSCTVEEGKIILHFPVYTWIDTYPDCDGENDRWVTRKAGVHTLTFNIAEKTISVN